MGVARKRLDPQDLTDMVSLKHWGEPPENAQRARATTDAVIDCGWGRLLFGQTFSNSKQLAETLQDEEAGRRDVALYVRDPHVVLSINPNAVFLDPSHTFRLTLTDDIEPAPVIEDLKIRSAKPEDEDAINAIYLSRSMVPVGDGYLAERRKPKCVTALVAEEADGALVGVVMGVDHYGAFHDIDNGSSLWSLAVGNQVKQPGIGRSLVLELAHHFRKRHRSFMDLSVMHDNDEAQALYAKLGFEQVPVYCIKRKNPVNEKLFTGPNLSQRLNIYAQIIVDEARRRGITVEIEDAEAGLFSLSLGGRSVACRESLSDLTSAVAMCRCDDKALTHRILAKVGLRVPAQLEITRPSCVDKFMERFPRLVVKPARGEQGRGVFVDLSAKDDVVKAVEAVKEFADVVLLEEFCSGEDVRIIVIDNAVVAAAVRRPAAVVGDGQRTVRKLIEKHSRRRAAATKGESTIPLDKETERCVAAAGHRMSDVIAKGISLTVRKTANLHTGGTIHDVTSKLKPSIRDAAITAAQALNIPVVGLDFLMPDISGEDYVIIEANERPGLANHAPAPTAERFVDLLFPLTRKKAAVPPKLSASQS